MMSVKNDEKIKNFLTENKDQEFKVSDLAEKVSIDIKNMGRYLKQLEEQQQIKIRTAQEGKIRTKFISFAQPSKSEIQADPPGPTAIEPQEPEPQKPQIQEVKPIKAKKVTDEISRKLNLNEILLTMQKMKPEDFPAYRNTLKQLHEHKKKIFIEEMVNFLNAEIL